MIYLFEDTTPWMQANITRAMEHAINYLPGLIDHDVMLTIEANKHVDTSIGIEEYQFGFADEVDEYNMTISTAQTFSEIIKSVFHEMKHLEQIVQRRLDPTADGPIWEGIAWPIDPNMLPLDRYYMLPWEAEAICFEQKADTLLITMLQLGYDRSNNEELDYGVLDHGGADSDGIGHCNRAA